MTLKRRDLIPIRGLGHRGRQVDLRRLHRSHIKTACILQILIRRHARHIDTKLEHPKHQRLIRTVTAQTRQHDRHRGLHTRESQQVDA